MNYTRLTLFVAFLAALAFSIPVACTKNSTPPVTDTVTVVKNDTTIKIQTDTLYATKPDSTVNLSEGLLVYLNFSGNIADSSGNNNTTQAVGNVLTYDEHGYANNAFGATGNGERIYVTNNGSIQYDTAWSISLAFMVNDNRLETFVSMVDPTNAEGPTFNFGTVVSSPAYYLACGSGDASTDCSSFAPVNNYNITDTTYWVPNPGSWYKAVVIYHKGTIQTYINGTLISTKVGSGAAALLCPNSQLVIGNWWNGNPPNNSMSMSGKLDNIRLYNRVLTPHEIAALSTNYQVTSNSQRPAVRAAPVHKTF
jgi:hypothetical protein